MAPIVAAYVSDLIFQSKIAATARAAGATLRVSGNLDRWAAQLADANVATALIDLNAAGDPLAAIRVAREATHAPRVVCYVSHVQTDLIEAARAAGADEVLARSAFVTRLPEWFGADAGAAHE